MIAFGGAGPVHADGLARKLGVPRILVPLGAGVFSALGFLVAPVSFATSRTRPVRLAEADPRELDARFQELEAEAAAVVHEAAPGLPVDFARAADICYAGQGHQIRVPLGPGVAGLGRDEVAERFSREYRARYGYRYEDLAVELVTLRVLATARREAPPLVAAAHRGATDASAALKGLRPAYSPAVGGFVPHRVYARERLGAGATLAGPAIVEEDACTLIVGAGAAATVDGRGWVLVELGGGR
jgi:N-methylhydantoinase A